MMPRFRRAADGSNIPVKRFRRGANGLDLPIDGSAPVATPSPGTGSSNTILPKRAVIGYFECYDNYRIVDENPIYNVLMYAFAIGVGDSDPGAVTMWDGFEGGNANNINTLKADLAALRERGVVVLLSIGGAQDLGPRGVGYRLSNSAEVTRFYDTVRPLIDYGFAGIDWDLENAREGFFRALQWQMLVYV